ncbi:hydroxymethylglutaryl-CoA synthase [Brachybacterium hainanense]|uniref:Hydroxymethylglutaryl-CoA synthase n=1 Tax=Brachybacterium hainanense TaxID=1541174 RepID=A0ABV6R8X0_9MICO
MSTAGIHDLELATTHHVLDMADLAAARGVDPNKYLVGIGQSRMSVPAPDEDVVTMAATAASRLLERHGTEDLRALLVATETGVDQSKAVATFVHGMLGLPSSVRSVELKQACYGGTAALQMALGIVAREPSARVLVISTDVARYALGTPGEPTQGAAAVAMLVTAEPALLAIEPVSGLATIDVDDFWRPNDSTTAVVDGALSMGAYQNSLTAAWDDFAARGGAPIEQIDRFVHHQPFTKMARKAHMTLARHTGVRLSGAQMESGLAYNRELGNSYTASLYVALASLLDAEDDLAGKRVGLFSYGSGSVGEFFTGIVGEDYLAVRRPEADRAVIEDRVPVGVEEYMALHRRVLSSEEDAETPRVTRAPFRFAGIQGRARRYEATGR